MRWQVGSEGIASNKGYPEESPDAHCFAVRANSALEHV